MSKLRDKYLKKEPPLTEEEKNEILRRGNYTGGTLLGVGSVATGLGVRASRKLKNKELLEKLGQDAEKHISQASRLKRVGLATAGLGLATLGSVHAYKHYKNRKEKEKTFTDIPAIALEEINLRKAAVIRGLQEQAGKRQRSINSVIKSAQIADRESKKIRNMRLAQVVRSARPDTASVGLYKPKVRSIKPVKM